MIHAKEHAEFVTITCLDWKPILEDDRIKNIIIESLTYLTTHNRISVYAFVIMSNHMHLIWQMLGDHKRENVQRDFLKYTAQKVIKYLEHHDKDLLAALLIQAKDRKYQVWQRNSLGVPLWSDSVLWQKLEYIHNNPVKAGMCRDASEYVYSSARFYFKDDNMWKFLSSCQWVEGYGDSYSIFEGELYVSERAHPTDVKGFLIDDDG